MIYSKDKKINEKVREMLKTGWVIKSRNRHLKIKNEVTGDLVIVPFSPSDNRSAQNWLHQIRSYGSAVPC